MLYFKFRNYEEFKAQFGTRVANNGKSVRSNHILLSFYKHEFKCRRFYNLGIKDVNAMYRLFRCEITNYPNGLSLVTGLYVYSNDYELDDNRGLCDDGDSKCVRYVRKDNGKVYKMKAGKFMRNVLESCGLTEKYCEQAVIYVCERFAEDWQAYIKANYGDGLTLHVNDDFYRLYDSKYLKGDFGSCMVNDEQYSFYENAVEAKAAYLENSDNEIVARCIIFTEVHDRETGEVLRLAERQYASDGDNSLKQVLVNKLIKANEIDGYKQVGVDCHNARAYLLNDGTSLKDHRLYISCNLEDGDTISYQDSFKYFDYDCQRADNHGYGSYDLAVTESTFEQNEGEWDEYNECYCDEVVYVYVWRDWSRSYARRTCDVDRLDDFIYVGGEYYDDMTYSEYDDCHYPNNEVVYSNLHDSYLHENKASWCEEAEDYFSYDNYHKDFEEWKRNNWEYDEYNDEYVEKTISCLIWNEESQDYWAKDVSREYAEEYFYFHDGEWYDQVNEDGIPYPSVEELAECV